VSQSLQVTVAGEALQAATVAARHRLLADDVPARLQARDASLWGAEAADEAAKRLGWLDVAATAQSFLPELRALRDALRDEGLDRVVLCGMGGSSLAPEVICRTPGVPPLLLDTRNRVAAGSRREAASVMVLSSVVSRTYSSG